MFKRIFLGVLIFYSSVYSHKLLLNVMDNDDNTLTLIGVYDTGQSAANAKIRLEALNSGDILYEARLPDSSEVVVKIPNEPYQIVLDDGVGHMQIKEGIPPKGGFLVKQNKEKKAITKKQGLNLAYILSLSLAICLMCLTMFFSYKNTNKLIEKIKNEHNSINS